MIPIGDALVNRTWRQMHNRKIGHLRFFVIAILAASAAAPVALSQSAERPTVIDFRDHLSVGRSEFQRQTLALFTEPAKTQKWTRNCGDLD